MYRAEDRHFWFVAKHRLLYDLLARENQSKQILRLADAGCGTGSFLASVSGMAPAIGIEPDALALEFCRRRGMKLLIRGTVENLGLASESIDAIVSSDVMEHLDDDVGAAKELYRVLIPGGLLILTVPAIPWLMGPHDEALGHKRRYTKRLLKQLLFKANFTEERIFSFMSSIAPAVLAVRLIQKLSKETGARETVSYDTPDILNRALLWILDIERKLTAYGVDFLIGTTLVAVARKPTR